MKRQDRSPLALIFVLLMALVGAMTQVSGTQAQATTGNGAKSNGASNGTVRSLPVRLVALGDSLTAGYGLPATAAFPAALERALRLQGYPVEIVNAGVSGDTASGGLERVDWSIPEGTDGVILALGANDMLRGLDPAITKNALEGIIQRLRARNIPVLLAGMYATRNLGAEYVSRFDAIYRDLADRYGLVLYPFLLDGVAGERALNLPDGMHPTAQGVEVIVSRILPSVEAFLARIGAQR